jgi:hypothetical protein
MPEPIPAMTVTIEVDGGPTVRLAYDGGDCSRPFVPHAAVTVLN